MKRIYILVFFLLVSYLKIYPQYWEKVTNIPTPYNTGYYLDLWILPSDNNYMWACGFNGFVIRSTNGGNSWLGSQLPYPAHHIESIQFVNKYIGYASGVEGIFKSTDGGASWFDITPSQLEDYWGCYFINENIGVLLGGGCDGLQRFYKTTDGGANWTLFIKTVPNTGLTDPILYPSGLGYAVSSGRIWITNDTGSTWNIFSNSGSEVWQEELSILGNSMLVPTAGVTCSGGENTGGMRFSTNMGSTWKEFQTGYSMFGAFLISETQAWACGYNRSVYYTSDAGTTWHLRNCGIENVHLDDITFTSPTDGWVVGEGIYRLKPTKITANRDTIDFGRICPNEVKLDTFEVINQSFFPADLTVQIILDFDDAFSIERPSYLSQIANCDSTDVIVKFSPPKNKNFQSTLIISAQSDDGLTHFSKEIILIGEGIVSTIKPDRDSIVLNPIMCGDTVITSLKWFADSLGESISSSNSLTPSNNQIRLITSLPVNIPPSGANTQFRIQLLDTGWSIGKYRFYLDPCGNDTTITIKAYGVSPIINSIDSLNIKIRCEGTVIDTIPIRNTGNYPLEISNLSFTSHLGNIQILGWTSKKQLPISIPAKSSDSLIIQYSANNIGKEIFYLSIQNNDRTLARGSKQPYSIMLVCTLESENVSPPNNTIDLGKVCLNSQIDTSISLINRGNITANLEILKNCHPPFSLQINNSQIEPDENVKINFRFSPTIPGQFYDTLIIKTGDCKEISLFLTGIGLVGELASEPDFLEGLIITNQTKNFPIKISNIGNIPLDIVNYTFNPPLTGFSAELQPLLSQTIDSNQSISFILTIITNQVGSYRGEICFVAEGTCPTHICIPIELTGLSRSLTTDSSIIFPTLYCGGEIYDTLWINNYGIVPDTVTQVSLSGDNSIEIISLPQLPAIINGNDSIPIVIRFRTNDEGIANAILHIETVQPLGQIFDIPITASFYKSIINSNIYTVDFGTIERCNEPISKQFKIYNQGMADEILYTINRDYGNYFSIDITDNFVIKGKDSIVVVVTFYPEIAQKAGNYSGKMIWTTTLCPDTIGIEFTAEIIAPHLSYSKFDIDFNNVWKDDIKYDTILITNNSSVPREINIIKYPENSDFQINAFVNNALVNFPISIAPQSIAELRLSFTANKVGIFSDNFLIEESSVCRDTIEFLLHANVPYEQYTAKIFIDDYIANYGDTLSVYIELSDDLPRINANSIAFILEFDSYLFHTLEASIRSADLISYIPINYKKSLGKIEALIDSSYSYYLLHNKGKIIAIKGVALYSSPTHTPLIIADFQVQTEKELFLTEEDGNLNVLGICEPIAQHRLVLDNTMAFIVLVREVIEDGNLELNCYNLPEGTQIYVFNTFGQKVKEQTLPKGTNSVSISVKEFGAGVYFISFNKSDLGKFQFILIK